MLFGDLSYVLLSYDYWTLSLDHVLAHGLVVSNLRSCVGSIVFHDFPVDYVIVTMC